MTPDPAATVETEHAPVWSTDARTLPSNTEAERAVLGTFFLNDSAVEPVCGRLTPEDFYDPRHQEIYRVILGIHQEGLPVDPMIVMSELRRRETLERVGGAAYVTGLEMAVIAPGNVVHHAEIVHEKSLLRSIIRDSTQISDTAFNDARPSEVLGLMSDRLRDLERRRAGIGAEAADMKQVVAATWAATLDDMESTEVRPGFGIPWLDKSTGGLRRGDLVVLAARPSVGKTALALQCALLSVTTRLKTGFFSFEMPGPSLLERMAASASGYNPGAIMGFNAYSWIRDRKFRRTDGSVDPGLKVLQAWYEAAQEWPLHICDKAAQTIEAVVAGAVALSARVGGLDLIVVDYLQLLKSDQRGRGSRTEEVSHITGGLKDMARRLDVPVLALSQLNRANESDKRRPALSDLRESGSIEQDADVVVFLHRTDKGDVHNGWFSLIEAILAKQRNGPIGTFRTMFDGKTQTFTAHRDEQGDPRDGEREG